MLRVKSLNRVLRRLPNFVVFCRYAATRVVSTPDDPSNSDSNIPDALEMSLKEQVYVEETVPSKYTKPSVKSNSFHSSDPLSHFSWIADVAPSFPVNGKKIEVLSEPSEFYQKLKELAKSAKRRIVLASLYLGTGQLEQELIECIQESSARSKSAGNEPLRISVLLDYMRGSRGQKNSRTMLLPLLQEFGPSVTIALYHTPKLRGVVKALLPERYNETVGVNHIKAYIFDDTVIISGANLSDSYFTNRQDRYVVLSDCPSVADYFDRLVTSVQRFSLHLQPDDTVRLADGVNCHPYQDKDGGKAYRSTASRHMKQVLLSSEGLERDSVDSECDTVVYPLIQMKQFDIAVDEYVTSELFKSPDSNVTIYLASGYLNLVDHYTDSIIRHCSANFRILTAAPEANGFFGSKGFSSAIPDAYTYIAKKFYEEVLASGQQKRITLHEFSRPEWTVHAKGLWYYLPQQSLPAMSMVGSPNFGYRSVYRDLEAQVAIVTRNTLLQQQLHGEQLRLYDRSQPVSERTFEHSSRRIPRWVAFCTPFIRNFF